jgi:hypothetical protein
MAAKIHLISSLPLSDDAHLKNKGVVCTTSTFSNALVETIETSIPTSPHFCQNHRETAEVGLSLFQKDKELAS